MQAMPITASAAPVPGRLYRLAQAASSSAAVAFVLRLVVSFWHHAGTVLTLPALALAAIGPASSPAVGFVVDCDAPAQRGRHLTLPQQSMSSKQHPTGILQDQCRHITQEANIQIQNPSMKVYDQQKVPTPHISAQNYQPNQTRLVSGATGRNSIDGGVARLLPVPSKLRRAVPLLEVLEVHAPLGLPLPHQGLSNSDRMTVVLDLDEVSWTSLPLHT